MTPAQRIITAATQAANNEQARQQLDGMGEAFRIIAEMRWKMFTAYKNEGFDDDQAMFLLSLDIEAQQQ
jgi:hypothetical protein